MATKPKRTDLKFEEFRKLLTEERNRILGLRRKQHDAMVAESKDFSDNELSAVSTYDSAENEDTAVALADRERDEALDENERNLLKQVEDALTRLDDGTYGYDEITGEPIPIQRLRAVPWATMTVETAERYQQ